MRVPLLAPLLVAALFSGCAQTGGHAEDDLGRRVDVDDLSRIVPTSVDVVEILLELGHRDRIAAVPDWIDSTVSCVTPPAGIDGIPQIGKPHVIQAEEVLAARPSLVIQKDHPLQSTPLHAQLEQAGVPVYVIRNEETLDNVRHTYRTVAAILEGVDPDAPARAEAAIAAFDARLDDVASALADRTDPTPRALYQFPAGLVAGQGTSASLALELAGARDVAADAGLTGYKQMSPESVAAADPERAVASCTAAGSADAFYGPPKFASTTAARLRPESLRVVDPSVTGLVGPRFPGGVQALAQWLHPAAFDLVQPNITWHREGQTLHVDASASAATEGPLRFRFLAGDGSPARDGTDGRFQHEYTTGSTATARLLLIDAQDRIHEDRHPFSP